MTLLFKSKYSKVLKSSTCENECAGDKMKRLLLLLPISTRSPQFDMKGSDSQLLASLCYVLGSQHSGIRRRLIPVGLHFHATSYSADSFPERRRSALEMNLIPAFPSSPETKSITSLLTCLQNTV